MATNADLDGGAAAAANVGTAAGTVGGDGASGNGGGNGNGTAAGNGTTAGNGTAGNAAGNGGNHTVARLVVPFAPLALALLAQGAVLGGGTAVRGTDAVACGDDIATYQDCHSDYPSGCSKAAGYDAVLNLMKNQLIPPATAALRDLGAGDYAKLEQELPSGLAKDNHADYRDDLAKLGEGRVHRVTGYLYYAKKGGKESSNCQLTELTDIDFHLGIGFDAALGGKIAGHDKLTSDERTQVDQSSVVVEMTPHWRARYAPDWTLDLLAKVVGRQVRATGQLVVDNEHFDPNDDCAVAGASERCWRASIWELHPVTRFEVCRADSCDAASTDWADLEDFAAPSAAAQAAGAAQPPAAAAPGGAAKPAGGGT
jgi:hypothetical protein